MSQNTSYAVMAQRVEPASSLDFFPTPPWATRALCEYLKNNDTPLDRARVWEPACGQGHMVRPLREYARRVHATDIHDYGFGDQVVDFLRPGIYAPFEWIITNPPFRLAEDFALTALKNATEGVALIVRTAFLEGRGRYERLFSKEPPSVVLQFTERVPMYKDRLVKEGGTATSYCWIVWRDGWTDTRLDWIPPCRRALERPEDYN